MRRPFFSDVSTAARALLMAPSAEREGLCQIMVREAELADRFARRLGKPHPKWGSGTLCEAAMRRRPAAEPGFDDPDYCSCFMLVLQQLGRRPRSAHM